MADQRNRPTSITLPCKAEGCEGKHGPKSQSGLCRKCHFALHERQRVAGLQAYAATDKAKANLSRAALIRHRRTVEWCPPEYLAQYRWLTASNRFGRVKCAEAKRLILEQIEVDKRRRQRMSFAERLAHAERTGQLTIAPAFVRHHLTPRIAA